MIGETDMRINYNYDQYSNREGQFLYDALQKEIRLTARRLGFFFIYPYIYNIPYYKLEMNRNWYWNLN